MRLLVDMDHKQQKWHEQHTKNIRLRESTNKERLLRRKLDLQKVENKKSNRRNLYVPEIISLFDNYEETVVFINTLHERVFRYEEYVRLNFDKCKTVSMEACVYLAAEIQRCNHIVPESVTGTYPKDDSVYFFINELGFFSLLGIKADKTHSENSDKIDILRLTWGSKNITKDNKNPENLMKGVRPLFQNNEKQCMHNTYSRNVYPALTEAMINSVDHAYPDDYFDQNANTCIPRWWRSALKTRDDNSIYMVLYDQGKGIPNTITSTWKENLSAFISQFSREPDDGEKIALAMKQGRTRTQKSGRGQGSYNIQQLISQSPNSVLNVYSYTGEYTYHSDESYDTKTHQNSLNGTLIIWKICLGEEE
jgi:hypothetical protein